MKTRTYPFVLLIVAALCFSFSSQKTSGDKETLIDVLNNINEFYAANESVYHEFNYNLYSDAETSEIHSQEKGIALISKSVSYAKLGEVESVSESDFTVAVDHEEKVVVIANTINPSGLAPVDMIESYAELASGFSVATLENGLSQIEISQEKGQVEKVQIIYDSATFQLHKIINYYGAAMPLDPEHDEEESDWSKPRLEVEYLNTATNGEQDHLLDYSKIVQNGDSGWKLMPDYSGYELINNMIDPESIK
jgi:hypothetical protein